MRRFYRLVRLQMCLDLVSNRVWEEYYQRLSFLYQHQLLFRFVRASCIDKTNESLARVQQVKKFVILPCPWTPETGELTPTLKLKRFYITKKYSAIVDKLYNDNSSSNHAA